MKWSRRIIWMRISRIAIIVSLVLTVAFAAFTIYGNNVGNFVINSNPTAKAQLSLSDVADRSTLTSRLTVNPPKAMEDYSYRDIPTTITTGVGGKNHPYNKYMAFSFYLVNESTFDTTYAMEVKITGERLNMADAMRVLVIEGEDYSSGMLYGKREETDEATAIYNQQLADYGYAFSGSDAYPTTIDFVDDHTVMSQSGIPLAASDYHKYTLVIWLEGCDPQCNDDILMGGVRMQLNFYGSAGTEE